MTWITAASNRLVAVQDEPRRLEASSLQEEPILVGRHRDDVIVTPVNQLLTPAGTQVELPAMRPQAMALSPDGTRLVVSGKTSELVVIDPDTGAIRQRVDLPSEAQSPPAQDGSADEPTGDASPNNLDPDRRGQVSYTGLVFSDDGRTIYMSNVNGSIKVFTVDEDGTVAPAHTLPLPAANAPHRQAEIPSGLALDPRTGHLLVCGNLSNRLLELDVASGEVVRAIDVGVAPYDVVLVGERAFVSNWGGRRPGEGDLTGPAGRGTTVRVDPVRHIASEGSVSVIDMTTGESVAESVVGLHASALAADPSGAFVICANAGSDNLSVLNAATGEVVETIWTKANPSELFGAIPNALAFDRDGQPALCGQRSAERYRRNRSGP